MTTRNAPPRPRTEYADTVDLGAPVTRVDGPAKVTGSAKYSTDRIVDGLAYGYLVLSTIANGTVREMRVDAALAAPGVIAVFTPFQPLRYAGPWQQGSGYRTTGPRRFPLQPGDREVRHYGQVIGLVVAETFEQARDAAALIETEYDVRTPTTSFRDEIPNATVPPPGLGGQPTVERLEQGVGSIDEALSASQVRVRATYSQRPEHHNPMEPHGAVAAWDGDRLTLYSGAQAPLLHATEVAAAMEVDTAQVNVIGPYVGGAFGGKSTTWPPIVLAAAAAREVGRPVKLVATREQLFSVTGHRPAAVQTVELGADTDGRLRAIKHECVSSASTVGAYYTHGARYSLDVYPAPNLYASTRVVTLDVPPATIMRAPTEQTGSFALECAMDELAYELGMDPLDLRLRNDTDRHPLSGLPYSGKHLAECLTTGAERFGWAGRPREPRAQVDGEWLVGTGLAVIMDPAFRFEVSMRVAFGNNGRVGVGTVTADPGTGMWTVLAIVAADRLGIPLDRIDPALGRSALGSEPAPSGDLLGAVASSASSSCGPAVVAACDAAIEELIRHAVEEPTSPFYGRAPEDVRYRDGMLESGADAIGFGELLEATGAERIEARTTSGPGPEARQYAMACFGAHFCEVRVNRYTGEPRVSRAMTVVDAGTILNPSTARNQIAGGVVWGMGQALFEGAEVEPATGRIANADFAGYLIPVNADVPDVDVQFLEYPDTIFNPVGSRGIGELAVVGSAAAIANAVYHATGIRVRDLPITPDKLLA